jgi:hypothetical protein
MVEMRKSRSAHLTPSTGGEIGIRSGFRFRRRKAYEFNSRPVHNQEVTDNLSDDSEVLQPRPEPSAAANAAATDPVEASLSVALTGAPSVSTTLEGHDVGQTTGPSDLEIERRLVEAELAGRSTVADALARVLEARRVAHVAGNVISIEGRRRDKQ